MTVRNQAKLITYPDSLGGDLQTLDALLHQHFTRVFPGEVHILPPFPSSGDRGFALRSYFEIEPRFGDWSDIRSIARRFPVALDLMVNHLSRQSPYFQDFKAHGCSSPDADLFLTLDKVWQGDPPDEDVAQIFLRRPEHPFAEVTIHETGEDERVWATFGTKDWSEQIDLDVHSLRTRHLFHEILTHFSQNGVSLVRLDAIAFVIKKPGTSRFFVEPEIYEFLDWIQAEARALRLELLPEVHADFSIPQRLAARGLWTYNFVLPLLVLHALMSGSSRELKAHLRVRPRRQFTMRTATMAFRSSLTWTASCRWTQPRP